MMTQQIYRSNLTLNFVLILPSVGSSQSLLENTNINDRSVTRGVKSRLGKVFFIYLVGRWRMKLAKDIIERL